MLKALYSKRVFFATNLAIWCRHLVAPRVAVTITVLEAVDASCCYCCCSTAAGGVILFYLMDLYREEGIECHLRTLSTFNSWISFIVLRRCKFRQNLSYGLSSEVVRRSSKIIHSHSDENMPLRTDCCEPGSITQQHSFIDCRPTHLEQTHCLARGVGTSTSYRTL
jgi:hypothetical protein